MWYAVNTVFDEEIKDYTPYASLDDEEDIAATRPFYRRRSLAISQPYLKVEPSERNAGGAQIIRLVGDLDLSTVLPFRDAAFTAIGTRPPRLVVDLTDLDRIDITGLNTLLTVVRVGRLVHVPVYINPSERIRAIFTATGLIQRIPFEPDDHL
jgi:anti-anti-sigma factor